MKPFMYEDSTIAIEILLLIFPIVGCFFLVRRLNRNEASRSSRMTIAIIYYLIALFVASLPGFALYISVSPVYFTVSDRSGSWATVENMSEKYRTLRQDHFYVLATGDGGKVYKRIDALRRVEELKSAGRSFELRPLKTSKSSAMSYQSEVDSLEASKEESFVHAITVAEAHLQKKLPADLFIDAGTRGNSAGLMTTLELIHQFGEEDLLKGHKICGTGTMDLSGSSGSIGGLSLKLDAAEKGKFEFCLIDHEDYKRAVALAKDKGLHVQLVDISTIDDALKFLHTL
ncbi:hypothetical protein GZH47_32340 (plasmid) [Paenibacillus rhizovicinus]|uniref:Lon proteolytic domain-containing protein n=1 Tax=Paenibacillus rhizovicinus TaxID=2704463 RepID=A0A6C0PAW4_9BACL|nr:hypothetical protein [Paenibacillus rhizovicinus]QHW35576.1 hypothetical protein GZH47_32340 [Paenibacillus rhizovicinus]